MSPFFGGSQPQSSGGGIMGVVLKFLQEDKWNFQQIEGKPILRMGFTGNNGSWQCFAQSREEQQQFIFYSILQMNVPADKRPLVADFLTRANYGLILGNFEMDMNDGEVRFKTSIDVQGGQLTTGMVKTMIYVNVLMMDKYLPGIMSVTYGAATPADAIAKIEGK